MHKCFFPKPFLLVRLINSYWFDLWLKHFKNSNVQIELFVLKGKNTNVFYTNLLYTTGFSG